LFKEFPVDVGIVYSGERIRGPDTYVSFGGDDVPYKFELVQARAMNEIEDGKVIIVGPDLPQIKEGSKSPLGILIEVAGAKVEKDLEAVIERRIHEYTNFIEGVMHLNQRYTIFVRISKGSYKKGLNSLAIYGKILMKLFKAELPIIEKMQVTFLTDEAKVKEMYQKALEIYSQRDERARALKDEDVEEFYGCVLCQSFAPTHCCIITPERWSLCGAINWFDGRASARVDPRGPVFKVDKGQLVDEVNEEYTGVNKVVQEKSLGETKRVYLHSMFKYPHTSCGCFEAIAFYIPEVDGAGVVGRDYREPTVNGLTFSSMANVTGGGAQTEGFVGIAINYMRSRKFFKADGGWSRFVWLPSYIKERVKDAIPKDLIDKIATEKEAKNIDQLREFLIKQNHPVVQRWKEKAPPAAPAEVPAEEAKEVARVPEMEIPAETIGMPVVAGGGGFKIILKNAKIHAEKLIIKKIEKK
jgi:acetyl-CoA decarbonylase/synthase complex subunit beta